MDTVVHVYDHDKGMSRSDSTDTHPDLGFRCSYMFFSTGRAIDPHFRTQTDMIRDIRSIYFQYKPNKCFKFITLCLQTNYDSFPLL